MERIVTRQKRTPFPTTHNTEQKQTAFTEDDITAASQQGTPFLATQNVEPWQPPATKDEFRLRAYETYLERDDNPGDDIAYWLQAKRELLAD